MNVPKPSTEQLWVPERREDGVYLVGADDSIAILKLCRLDGDSDLFLAGYVMGLQGQKISETLGPCSPEPFVTGKTPRNQRQELLARWAEQAFGRDEAASVSQRGLRLLEEAIEAFQACGGDEAIAHKLVSFVFARPVGALSQELGGVAVTTLALAAAAGLSADEEECREICRVLSMPLHKLAQRNASKNAAGFKMEAMSRGAEALGEVPDVVHILSQENQPYGSERRCCNHCGIMIWGSSAPRHVDNWENWRAHQNRCEL